MDLAAWRRLVALARGRDVEAWDAILWLEALEGTRDEPIPLWQCFAWRGLLADTFYGEVRRASVSGDDAGDREEAAVDGVLRAVDRWEGQGSFRAYAKAAMWNALVSMARLRRKYGCDRIPDVDALDASMRTSDGHRFTGGGPSQDASSPKGWAILAEEARRAFGAQSWDAPPWMPADDDQQPLISHVLAVHSDVEDAVIGKQSSLLVDSIIAMMRVSDAELAVLRHDMEWIGEIRVRPGRHPVDREVVQAVDAELAADLGISKAALWQRRRSYRARASQLHAEIRETLEEHDHCIMGDRRAVRIETNRRGWLAGSQKIRWTASALEPVKRVVLWGRRANRSKIKSYPNKKWFWPHSRKLDPIRTRLIVGRGMVTCR